MKLRYEKSVRVMSDIMGYCHLIGCNRFKVDFEMKETTTEITIVAEVPNITEKQLKEMTKLLNMPRQHEVEQYYWNISGEEEIDNELSLAGMMTDEATVDYAEGVLTVTVLRCEDSSEA
ncbi:hypothetical protein LJC60_05235 [Ruminococcaceae bacterium OttesenSCG-928-D13]|nr:hypothetical protein [Ruminococcaceae bacterium OttesenSCG-928-D13]